MLFLPTLNKRVLAHRHIHSMAVPRSFCCQEGGAAGFRDGAAAHGASSALCSRSADRCWCIGYQRHPDVPAEVAVNMADLAVAPPRAGLMPPRRMERALVTSFGPFELSYVMRNLPPDVELTFGYNTSHALSPTARLRPILWCPLHRWWEESMSCSQCNHRFTLGRRYARLAGDDDDDDDDVFVCSACLRKLVNPQVLAPLTRFEGPGTCGCPPETMRRAVHHEAPMINEMGIMHCKLWLFLFGDILRVVVPSFNASERQRRKALDVFWWADVSRGVQSQQSAASSGFGRDLLDLLRRLQLPEWVTVASEFDFAPLDRDGVSLVVSAPHAHEPRIGLERLNTILQTFQSSFGSEARKQWEVTPVFVETWSIGGTQSLWYNEFTRTVTGIHDLSRGLDLCHFIFDGGNDYGESCIIRHRVHHSLCDPFKNLEYGSHGKVMVRMMPPSAHGCAATNCTKLHGWIYFGSHNLSISSWGSGAIHQGRLLRSPRGPSNWEVGVVIRSAPVAGASLPRSGPPAMRRPAGVYVPPHRRHEQRQTAPLNTTTTAPTCGIDLATVPLSICGYHLRPVRTSLPVGRSWRRDKLPRACVVLICAVVALYPSRQSTAVVLETVVRRLYDCRGLGGGSDEEQEDDAEDAREKEVDVIRCYLALTDWLNHQTEAVGHVQRDLNELGLPPASRFQDDTALSGALHDVRVGGSFRIDPQTADRCGAAGTGWPLALGSHVVAFVHEQFGLVWMFPA